MPRKNTAPASNTPTAEAHDCLLVNDHEAARILGLSRSYLRALRIRGSLDGRVSSPAFVRVGRRGIRYDRRDLQKWIEANRVTR